MTVFGLPESSLRFGVFLGVLLLMMAVEGLWPRRPLRLGRRRWPANLAMVLLGSLAVRGMAAASVPLVAVAAALWAQQAGVGLLNNVAMPSWLALMLALLALDAIIWAQHASFHRIPWFWRLHRVHHADQDIDVTTALRFHPVEIAASMLIKVAAVLLLGASAEAVVVFEIGLNAAAMFNHANLRLPAALDKVLRWVLVTPDMHRVHHSVLDSEHHRNFGNCLSVWDHLFGSYRAAPREGHQAMHIGLPEYQAVGQGEGPTRLIWCLALPWKRR